MLHAYFLRGFTAIIVAACATHVVAAGLVCSTVGTTVTIRTPHLDWQLPTVRQGDRTVVRPTLRTTAGSSHPARVGDFDLPYFSTLVALPDSGLPQLEILEQQFTVRTIDGIAVVDTGGRRSPEVAAAGSGAFAPALIAEFGKRGVMRGLRVVSVRIYPAQYNAAAKQLRLYSSIRIAVRPRPGSAAPRTASAAREFPAWDELAASMIGNYKDARQWRAAPAATRLAPPRAGIAAAASERIKMFVRNDGIFRVTGREFDSVAGSAGAGADPRTFHVYTFHPDTQEVPIRITGADDGRFDTGDTLEFAGHMHYGEEGDFYDDFTDDAVYWLLWGDPSPQLTYRPALATGGPAVTGYALPQHFERDIEYYQGDNISAPSSTLYVSGKVNGERFYWAYLDATSNPFFVYPFTVGGIPDDPSNATLRVRVRGVSNVSVPNDHEISLELNGDPLADVQFSGWEDTVITVTMPCKKLYAGVNTLVVKAVYVPVSVDQIAVDYIELDMPRQPVFAGDSLVLVVPAGPSTFTVHHAPAPDVTAFDQASRTLPVRVSAMGGTFVRIESRGALDSRFVRIEVADSTVFSGPYARGLTAAVIDAATAAVTAIQTFDTYADSAASVAFTTFLGGVQHGQFVAVAVGDEATSHLTAGARAALRALGSTAIDKLGYGDAFAFVGRAGDPSFIPVEAWSRGGTGGAHLATTIPTTIQRSWAVTFRDSALSASTVIVQPSSAVFHPRLVLRHATALRSPHRADYIVITHRSLITEARRLAAFRAAHDHIDTAVVDVEDIYDEFNGGIEREVPIREFLRSAYRGWTAPAPSVVVLFGDASWDPKFNTPGAWRKSLVPTYGKPVSDFWFTQLDGDDMLPDVFIGRIAAPTVDTARVVVDKIIAYEDAPPQRWNKKFLFVSGGFTFPEALQFLDNVRRQVPYVLPPPICGDTAIISRDNFDDPLQTDKSRAITDEVNAGVLWFTYFGHAAPNIFEIALDSASVFRNQGRLPFFAAYSCQTGAFAEPRIVAANEQYVIEPEKGFVGSWGISGFGLVNLDRLLMEESFFSFSYTGLRKLGAITTQAKVKMWETLQDGGDTLDVTNTIMQYGLLGDPATTLALRTHADVDIADSDVTVLSTSGGGSTISDQDTTLLVTIALHNDGLSSNDTVKVHLHDDYPGGTTDTSLFVAMPCRVDTLRLLIPVRRASGAHVITITLDPDHLLVNDDRSNNVAGHTAIVYSALLTVLRPTDCGSQAGSCRPNTLAALVPQVGASALTYDFEIDTTTTFTRPLAVAHGLAAPAGPVVEWTIPFAPVAGRVYDWRARTVNAARGTASEWVTSSFVPDGLAWDQRGQQFAADGLIGAKVTVDGVSPTAERQQVYAESRGFEVVPGGPGVRVQLGDQTPITDIQRRGMHVYVLSDSAFTLSRSVLFDTFLPDGDSAQSQQFADYIAAIPSGRTVIVAAADEVSLGLSQAGRDALRQLGATHADSIGLRSSYVLVGRKGAAPGTVPERFRSHADGAAIVDDTIVFSYMHATVTSPAIHGARSWSRASATFRLPAGTTAKATVLGRRLETWDTLGIATPAAPTVDLSSVDPARYRQLRLVGDVTRDDVAAEPVLAEWGVSYTPGPELLVYGATLTVVPGTVLEGETPKLTADVYNVGCVDASHVEVKASLESSLGTHVADERAFDAIAAGSSIQWQGSLITEGVRGPQSVLVTVDPSDSIPEIIETNNTFISGVTVNKDTTAPSVVVTVDGRQVLNGDIISPTPEIRVKVLDNSPLRIRDPQSIVVRIDSIEYSVVRTPGQMTIDTTPAGGVKASAVVHPFGLDSGYHEVRVYATDATRNTDSSYDRSLIVEGASSLAHVMNAPNPFARETWFTFVLGGMQPPTDARIKIYSVAGRLLRTIDVAGSGLRIGFNTVEWDGADQDGDRLANGVYLYRIIVRLPDRQLMDTQRLAILR